MQGSKLVSKVVWCIVAAVLIAPIVTWWRSVGDPSAYFTHALPPGQSIFIFAKLAGLLAIGLFWAQALLAMAPRVPMFRGFPALNRRAHIVFGSATGFLIAAHVGLFVVASSLRKKVVAWDLLLPNFDHGYYFLFITFGAFALYLLAIALFAGWRTHRGTRAWKKVHMLWIGVFAFALLHSIGIGSETRDGALRYIFLFTGSSLTLLVAARVWSAIRSRQQRVGLRKASAAASSHHNLGV
ncbi:hypothetical protein [Pseudoxanthomonas sacheonensis]|uniref:Tetrahydromethanopterin S-methyltransferase subunit D n=1 Tax=Pseudoxanthomonas sacheonensis TaxID=443615 RepID=A0ABU1RR16_9GAMM|nr:hypothetical protein [Pseudoxanthomonas sacheonensis]MDR6841218.1 tetrahydromethanopterin S-methyltransferase subunit D [Pseudoxanthomonas sacheonensis]